MVSQQKKMERQKEEPAKNPFIMEHHPFEPADRLTWSSLKRGSNL
jgi:hypothetical protein